MSTKSLSEVHSSVKTNKKGLSRLFSFIGPAYLISVGYMDPGNWATDIAGGSAFGYKLIWVLLMSNLIAILLQTLSARLGIVSGMDLAQASRNGYPKWANIPLYILAEIAIAACDLAEITGMAIGLNLLFGIPVIYGIAISALDTLLLLLLLKKGIRTLEAFIVSMVSVIGISFMVEMFIVSPDYVEVAKHLIPTGLDDKALYIAIGIIGATVMPHNLYLHSSLVQTRRFPQTSSGMKSAIRLNLIDTTIALNLAFFVNAAILVLAASAFYLNGYFNIAEIQDASRLLNNLFGSSAPLFFGIALVAAGQSSTITGTLAGQIVMEGHINLRIQPWLRRMITRLLAIIPAIFTIVYFGENALGSLLILSQVILSLQLGFAIIPLIHFNSDKRLMNEFTIKFWVKLLAWICAAIIVYLNIHLVIDELLAWFGEADNKLLLYLLVVPIIMACFALLMFIFVYPMIPGTVKAVTRLPHGKAGNLINITPIEYSNIGIAIDFIGDDQKLINNALNQGGNTSKYTLIHIVESAAARYHGENTSDLETLTDKASLTKYKEVLEISGYEVDIQIGFGNTSSAIARIINECGIDLLIMGVHGHKGIKDLILGTTVDSLRHKIKIPLLVIA